MAESRHTKVLIIGSGPSGLTAALYTARASLEPIVVEGIKAGGQLMITTDVENYPGFPDGIMGPEIIEKFKAQAERFGTRVIMDDITETDFTQRPFVLKSEDSGTVKAHSVIIATGARAKWLGIENEARLAQQGGGISACAVCDGALPAFRDKLLLVVGGGDTAMEEALHLTKFAGKVTVVHRRDELRASKVMQDRALANEKIEIAWNSVVSAIHGDDFITGVELTDTTNGEKRNVEVGGMFVAIGHHPNTDFLSKDITLDDEGYIVTYNQPHTNTSIEGVFAVGDVTDKIYRQAITAAGMGCKGALDAERYLADKGIH